MNRHTSEERVQISTAIVAGLIGVVFIVLVMSFW
jgi:hypothetical protein